jgi:hypothetical protein
MVSKYLPPNSTYFLVITVARLFISSSVISGSNIKLEHQTLEHKRNFHKSLDTLLAVPGDSNLLITVMRMNPSGAACLL